MVTARCIECSAPFRRRADEDWKMRCLACWRRSQPKKPAGAPKAAQSELAGHLRALIQLCHPDRHGGSTLAGEVTTWLLRVRKELSR